MEPKEITIPVPWGHIAGKAWGDDRNTPILMFHGILDNAGSFDRLIQFLPPTFYYICFDLPGHGKSSHFPSFFPVYTHNYLFAFKLITDWFERKQYIVMGHSYGGQLAMLYAQIYPEVIEKIIMLDCLYIYPVPIEVYKSSIKETIDSTLVLHKKTVTGTPPSYTLEEIIEKLMFQRRYGDLTEEAAKTLLERGIKSAGNSKYFFTTDQRLKFFVNPQHDLQYSTALMRSSPISCPVLIILAKETFFQPILFKPIVDIYKKNKRFTIKMVEGSHDVHNNNPEKVAPYIIKFLLNLKKKL